MLEQKVQELLETQKHLAVMNDRQKVELEPLQKELQRINGVWTQEKLALQNEEKELKEVVLAAMTEKTHKFECATITKRVTRKLVVTKPHSLFNLLPPALQLKTKLSFPNSDVMKAVDIEVVDINGIANIAETESLVVK